MSIGYVSDQLEKGPAESFFGLFVYGIYFFVYGIYFTFIAAAVVAVAGFIAAALAVMLPVSLLSAGVAFWRRHVLHQPGSFGELRPAWMKPTQWGNKKKRQGQAATRPAQVVAAPATSAPLPPEPPLTMPKRATQAWIEANVPNMSAPTLGKFMSELRKRNWSDSDIATRVVPHAHIAKEIEELRGVVERLAAEIAEPPGARPRGSPPPKPDALS